MKRKNILLLAFILIAAGCTIVEDDYLEDFPKDIRVNGIQISYTDATFMPKQVNAAVTYSSNKIQVNFKEGIDFLFLNSNVKNITYQLNANGYAEKITAVFENGTTVTDDLVYNSTNQIIEMNNSFFKDKLKLFYINNKLDNVEKVRTLSNGTTLSGAYKFDISSNLWVSIFPLDKTRPYSFTAETGSICTSNAITLPNNELFKTSYILNSTPAIYGSLSSSILCNYKVKSGTINCFNSFTVQSETYENFFKKDDYTNLSFPICYSPCQSVNYNHLSVLSLIPGIVPNANDAYMLTVENELREMGSNSPKASDFVLAGVKFLYESY